MENQPAYYAIIPADVRYSKVVCMGAKLLYGEITALCNKEGFCWASNQYFARLYDNKINTISRWVGELEKALFIRCEIDRLSGNQRKIYLSSKINIPITKNDDTPITKNGESNNIESNNKPNTLAIEVRKKKFYDEMVAYQISNSTKFPSMLYTRFFSYWTECNKKQTTMRFEKENFFELSKRLATFWSRCSDAQKQFYWSKNNQ